MLPRRRRKNKSSTHPSTTFTIHNNNNNVLSKLITNTSRLLHSKSTYFYNGWGRVIPSVCILALLTGLYFVISPISDYSNQTYAVDITGSDGGSSPSLTLTFKDAATQTTNATVGEIAYRTNQFTVASQRYKGYSIYVSGMSGKTTNLIGKNISSNIITGVGNNIAADTNFPDNKWGYAIADSAATSPSSLSYSTVPNYSDAIPKAYTHTITSPSAATSHDFLISFAVKFGAGMPSDNYQSDVMLSVVGDPVTVVDYSITYDKNTTDVTVANMPSPNPQTVSDEGGASNYTITLSSNVPTRAGYYFLGWGTTSNATTAQYQPGANVVLRESNKDITLYAVWMLPFGGITTMQAMTSTFCSNTKEGDVIQLTDTRDQRKYWVAKLKDGNCWMTQNLAYNGGGAQRSSGTCSGWVNDDAIAQYCPIAYAADHASRGNYYSWAGAMNGNASATGQVQGVCPSGWHLPAGNSTAKGSYSGLMSAYNITSSPTGSSTLREAPFYFVLGGTTNATGIGNVGNDGRYWTATPVEDGTHAYEFWFDRNSVVSRNQDRRFGGSSVRCLAD